MIWEKLGQIYNPEKANKFGYTHGANPFPTRLDENTIRIYFNCRDNQRKSYITFADYNMQSGKIQYINDDFILGPGKPGLFDDCGCSLGCVVDMPNGTKYMYYLGWNIHTTVPWMNYIGMAIIDKDGVCHKYSPVPILERNEIDYLSCSYPYVLYDKGVYRMWYGSNLKWGRKQEDMNHVIKYAESIDGINWKREGHVCICGKDETEYAFSKPSVWIDEGTYKMVYSYRGNAYRIGYATSKDGYSWERRDEEVGIDVSKEGWDSETLDYPSVFKFGNETYMLYCGNGYGATGFGLAKLIEK